MPARYSSPDTPTIGGWSSPRRYDCYTYAKNVSARSGDRGAHAGSHGQRTPPSSCAWPARESAAPLDAVDLSGRAWIFPRCARRAVLLNFWASWCGPCRAEMPTLQQLADFYGDDRLAVLALNFKEAPRSVARFADQDAAQSCRCCSIRRGDNARRWQVKVFPTTILIGADGRPRSRVRGEMDWTSQEAGRLVEGFLLNRYRRLPTNCHQLMHPRRHFSASLRRALRWPLSATAQHAGSILVPASGGPSRSRHAWTCRSRVASPACRCRFLRRHRVAAIAGERLREQRRARMASDPHEGVRMLLRRVRRRGRHDHSSK